MSADASEPLDSAGRRNLGTLFLVSTLIGFGVAVYEVVLPLYLKRVGLSWAAMGWIYGAAAVATFVIRVALGAWSDRVGRKVVYVGSLIATGLATALTPLFSSVFVQAVLKSVTDPTTRVREAMHSILLYEAWPARFQKIFGRTRGVEYLCHFLGLLCAAGILAWMARRGMASPEGRFILGAAGLLILSGVLFGALYREKRLEIAARPALSWRNLVRLRMARPLWILTISSFVFNAGITVSHCFALQLFFQEKYGASDADIFTLGALHRLSSGLTLLLMGHLFRRRLRMWMMLFLIAEGIFLAAPGFMPAAPSYHLFGLVLPTLWTAVAVWLAHDLLGMGLWTPIQQVLMQRYSGADTRGEEIGLSTALGALGAVPAPFVAGWLRTFPGLASDVAVNLPFIVSGIGVAVSALVLLWLPKEDK